MSVADFTAAALQLAHHRPELFAAGALHEQLEPREGPSAKLLIGFEHPNHQGLQRVSAQQADRRLQGLDALPVQLNGARGGRFEKRLPGPVVVRRGAPGYARAAVDLSVRETPDAVVAQDVDCGVEDLNPSFGVGGHQFL
jgi:hypothetical protein